MICWNQAVHRSGDDTSTSARSVQPYGVLTILSVTRVKISKESYPFRRERDCSDTVEMLEALGLSAQRIAVAVFLFCLICMLGRHNR